MSLQLMELNKARINTAPKGVVMREEVGPGQNHSSSTPQQTSALLGMRASTGNRHGNGRTEKDHHQKTASGAAQPVP